MFYFPVKRLTITLCFSFLVLLLRAQVCTTLGQNPETAFPVCGTSVFKQGVVPICGQKRVPSACVSPDVPITDKNPFWYSITCFEEGTLGFIIQPDINAEDYDWQLFDVTGRNPSEVYTNSALFVACNWSGEFGATGTSLAGASLTVCVGPGQPLFSSMPVLKKGHKYLLLVSHFSDTQSGYSLSFQGGTAVITDPLAPAVQKAETICENQVTVVLNKKMKCSSLTLNGSEFSISPNGPTVISAIGNNCVNGFDMDTVKLVLQGSIQPGNYNLFIQNGTDGNTLLDNCDRIIPVGSIVPFTVLPRTPVPFDSIVPAGCAPSQLRLNFKSSILCSSIAADGTDFIIEGPSNIRVQSAAGTCTDGNSFFIDLLLSQPIVVGGDYVLRLRSGGDNNTLLDACGLGIPAGSSISFNIKDTVSANFTYQLLEGCVTDTFLGRHAGGNGVNKWLWIFDGVQQNGTAEHIKIFDTPGQKNIQLIVGNGFCADTAMVDILIDEKLNARFEATSVICPDDSAFFKNLSTGNAIRWNWDFDNGKTSVSADPSAQFYPPSTANRNYAPSLTIWDANGCTSRVTGLIRVIANCNIDVPSAFSPNGDGLNDFFYPLNAYKTQNLVFKVFNRFGQLVFETRDWQQKWDGRIGGKEQGPSTFTWTLSYQIEGIDKQYFRKGVVTLIR
jgi:gliding motility-associated-like protein